MQACANAGRSEARRGWWTLVLCEKKWTRSVASTFLSNAHVYRARHSYRRNHEGVNLSPHAIVFPKLRRDFQDSQAGDFVVKGWKVEGKTWRSFEMDGSFRAPARLHSAAKRAHQLILSPIQSIIQTSIT